MSTIIGMIERKNAQLISQNPSTSQLQKRLEEVTDALGDVYRANDRLRADCRRALAERSQVRNDLAAQQRSTRNARRGEWIAAAAAVLFAVLAIVLAVN